MTNLLLSAILTGQILVHDVMPQVLDAYPERRDPGVQGYIATNDCAELGRRFVLVRPGQPDVLVAVADCAWSHHRDWRERHGYIADVATEVWRGPWMPQYAELWPVEARAEWWASIVPATRPGLAVRM